jgi:hypothetical protein
MALLGYPIPPLTECSMDPIAEALDLLRRQAQLETGLRQPGGIRVTEERELYSLG